MSAELLLRLQRVSDSPDALAECNIIRRSPRNEHYQPALALARLLLEGFSLTQTAGGLSAQSFLIDMNRLFETWVGDALRSRLWPDFEVVEQHQVPLSVSPTVKMFPDLLFRRGTDIVFVADVKYKLTSRGRARTDDYYQLLAYTTAMRLPHGLLIYCQADLAPDRVITVVGGRQRLHTHPIHLGGAPLAVAQALDRLADTIRQLLTAPAAPSVATGR